MLASFRVPDINDVYNILPVEIYRDEFSFIQEGYNKKSNEHVVIKTFSGFSNSITKKKQFHNTLYCISNINHPKCQTISFFYVDPKYIIIEPYIPKRTLNQALIENDSNFTPTKKMCTIYGICSTIQFFHDNQIAHLSFKPNNVLLDDDYDIRITDIGIYTLSDYSEIVPKKEGSYFNYLAPEILNSENHLFLNKSDVFSFGVTFYQYFSKLEKVDDNKGPIKLNLSFLSRINKGARFVKTDEMNDQQYNIYKMCTDGDPEKRPSFKDLCNIFENDETLWIKGTDKKIFHEYIENCKKIEDEQKQLQESKKLKKNIPRKFKKY